MKILRSVFLVVMLLVALLAVVDTAYGWPPCGYYDQNGGWHLYNRPAHYQNGVWVPADTEYAWWVNALCVTHEVTLVQFNYYCHTNYPVPPQQGLTPCTIAD